MKKIKVTHVPPAEEIHTFNVEQPNDDYVSQLVLTFTDPICYLDVYGVDGNIMIDHLELDYFDWEDDEEGGVPGWLAPYLTAAQDVLYNQILNR